MGCPLSLRSGAQSLGSPSILAQDLPHSLELASGTTPGWDSQPSLVYRAKVAASTSFLVIFGLKACILLVAGQQTRATV